MNQMFKLTRKQLIANIEKHWHRGIPKLIEIPAITCGSVICYDCELGAGKNYKVLACEKERKELINIVARRKKLEKLLEK